MIDERLLINQDGSPDIVAVDAWIGSEEARNLILSADFPDRCVALFRRFDEGETMALDDAAAAVGLPWPVFGVILGCYLLGPERQWAIQ